jgi:hypothetical protein
MLTTILEVAALLAVIIVPLRGPGKKKKDTVAKIDTDTTHSHYAINEDGDLVEIRGKELSGHTY